MKKPFQFGTCILIVCFVGCLFFGCASNSAADKSVNSATNGSDNLPPSPESDGKDLIADTNPVDFNNGTEANDESEPEITKPVESEPADPTESTPTPPDYTQSPTDPTDPVPTDPTDEPTQATTAPGFSPDISAEAYLAYYNMSADEQQDFINSFGSVDAFFAWHTAAKEAYENNRTPIDGTTPILP